MSGQEPGDLFAGTAPVDGGSRSSHNVAGAPLAERMRPASLEEIVGQDHLLGEGCLIPNLLAQGQLSSLILCGPAGCGKTTLARALAAEADATFVELSATAAGVKQVREAAAAAERLLRGGGRRTVVFIDEIHRFNKAQQDALLPWVESGAICLLGATTENPSFQVVAPLLSRCRVVRLEPLGSGDLVELLQRALTMPPPRGLGGSDLTVPAQLLEEIAAAADGDARAALSTLELAAGCAGQANRSEMTADDVQEALQRPFLRHGQEEHFDQISALQKSIRNSDPDAAVYWLARLLEAGDDAVYVARRLLVTAAEDVGLADPAALTVASSGLQAVQALGMPEGRLVLAEVTVYLAAAPKSNSAYRAYAAAVDAIESTGSLPVPMVLRNSPTAWMKSQGYGQGYEYAHATEHGVSAIQALPVELADRVFFTAGARGDERELGERVRQMRQLREDLGRSRRGAESSDVDGD